MSMYTPLLEDAPKARHLAEGLIEEAAEQGVSLRELNLACELALKAYKRAMEKPDTILSQFESAAKFQLKFLS